MRISHGAAAAVMLATGCHARWPVLTPEGLANEVQELRMNRTLQVLNIIAEQYGGNRAFGTPGYEASVDYILDQATERFHKKFDTHVQTFNHTYFEVFNTTLTVDGNPVDVISPWYNPPTPSGGITARLVSLPRDRESGAGCVEREWNGINVTGKIALIMRGRCSIGVKVANAKKHGAVGAIVWHDDVFFENDSSRRVDSLFAEELDMNLPTGIITSDIGFGLAKRIKYGHVLHATLTVDSVLETRSSWNVISQTKQGDPTKVIMLGAHLDSVLDGPGLNDNGSGAAALLELMESLTFFDGHPHAIRFAWWGAEESGLVGSMHYIQDLEPEEVDSIRYYFNLDTIGSPNPAYEIKWGVGSGIGIDLLEGYLTAAGENVTRRFFDWRSDYAGFYRLNIPCVGLFTGVGEHDPCNHKACDDVDNVDLEALTLSTKAVAHALGVLANSIQGLPPRRPAGKAWWKNSTISQFQV
ncbi:peptidase family M28 [Podospora aff. communis PSN243]|uniref:Peptide hydrolase n=1 Tax=Podospora aff. communis PSN243 TaxID=3040156 RepID=A0AAV9GSI6_9PEZI|nr:peptidase family M28 [Podospora aff. communis PSN243]